MKYFIFALILFMGCGLGVNASEVVGKISTDPAKNVANGGGAGGGGQADSGANQIKPAPAASAPVSGGAAWLYNKNQANLKKGGNALNASAENNVKVLGISKFPDKSLLRGSDKKIYFVMGKTKKHIASLVELGKYRGQAIYDAEDEILSEYQTRRHLDNELIREAGTVKVYAIRQGAKSHILNLEELRKHYFGLEIFNISSEEMMKY